MRTISISAFIAVMALLCSCTVYQNVPIDVLSTEEVTLPDKPLKIAFLYRNFKFEEDTMEHYYTKNGQLLFDKMNAKLNIDSFAVMSCLNSVANILSQQHDSLNVVYYPYDIMPRQRGLRINLLPVQQVKKLAFPAKADYLISLETLTYFFSQYKDYNGSYEQSCAMAAAWGIYKGETGQVVYRRTMTDTVYWNSQSKEPGSVAYPPRVPSIQLATGGFGEAFAKRFSPEWVTVNRTLIIPPVQEFKDAFDYTEKQDWENAAKIWMEYTPERFGRLAASACYNMALASEIHDNFESAADWITKAVKYASNYRDSEELHLSLEYQKILLRRMAVVERSEKRRTILD